MAVGLALALFPRPACSVSSPARTPSTNPSAMGRAGGLVGAAEGVPLQAGLASWGAGSSSGQPSLALSSLRHR